MLRKSLWTLMTVLSLLIAAYAVLLLVVPAMQPPLFKERLAAYPVMVIVHLVASTVAMVFGPFQLNTRLRTRFTALHRWMGRSYVAGVMIGGVAGLGLATVSQGGMPAHIGFAGLALAWLYTTGSAFTRILRRDVAGHRRMMIRSFALTFAAVTLRIYFPAAVAAGLPYEGSYQVIAWMCWVPNLLFAEWMLRRQGLAPVRPTVLVAAR